MTPLAEQSPRKAGLRWQLVVVGIGLLVVAAILFQGATAYETVLVASSGGIYVEGMPGSPRYINPVLAQGNQVDEDIASLVFSGLTQLSECGSVGPDLAESWTISPDGLEYTFQLRRDALWHDGIPVVAADVAFTIGVIQSPDFPGPPVLARFWSEIEVEAVSERVVRFRLPDSYGPFLAATNLGILPSHLLQGVPIAELTQAEFNRLPVGSGPFIVAESGLERVLLRANGSYYGLTRPYLDGIEFRFYRDPGEALRAHTSGEVMGVSGLSSDYLPRAAADQSLTLYSAPLSRLMMVLLDLNSDTATFLSDANVRRALQQGLDRSAIIGLVLEGRGIVSDAPFALCSWAVDPNGARVAYDPEAAAAALEVAGWVDGDGDGFRERDGVRMSLELLVPNDRRSISVANEVARQWQRLGVVALPAAIGFDDLISTRLDTGSFEAALVEVALGGDPDPYVLWHSSQIGSGGQNYTGFISREADELLEAARHSSSTEERAGYYHRFQAILNQAVPAVPLFYPVYTYAVDSDVRGVELAPLRSPSDRFRSVNQWYINLRRVRVRDAEVGPE